MFLEVTGEKLVGWPFWDLVSNESFLKVCFAEIWEHAPINFVVILFTKTTTFWCSNAKMKCATLLPEPTWDLLSVQWGCEPSYFNRNPIVCMDRASSWMLYLYCNPATSHQFRLKYVLPRIYLSTFWWLYGKFTPCLRSFFFNNPFFLGYKNW